MNAISLEKNTEKLLFVHIIQRPLSRRAVAGMMVDSGFAVWSTAEWSEAEISAREQHHRGETRSGPKILNNRQQRSFLSKGNNFLSTYYCITICRCARSREGKLTLCGGNISMYTIYTVYSVSTYIIRKYTI